jgi:hypothetical protein
VTLSAVLHAIIVTWLEGLRWRFQARFEGPLVERCRSCSEGQKCEANHA